MAVSQNEVYLLKRLVELSQDNYQRALNCNRRQPSTISQDIINALEAAWRRDQIELERVDPQREIK